MLVIENRFEIGQKVYLVSDPEQHVRIVTALKVFKAGEIVYEVACGTQESNHYDFELTTQKDLTVSI